MGLLGNGWDDPQSSAMLALAAGMVNGNLGAGILGANAAYGNARELTSKQKYVDAQTANLASEVETRKAALAKQQAMQDMLRQALGGGAPSQPGQLGSGSFGILPPPPGQSSIPQGGGRGGLGGMTPDALAMLKASGLDLVDVYKLTQPEWDVTGGYRWNKKDPGNAPGFMPAFKQTDSGMSSVAMPDGRGGLTVSAPRGAVDTYRDFRRADEETKAGVDLVKITGPDGAERYVTRAQAAQAAQGGPKPDPFAPTPRQPASGSVAADTDRFAILQQELQAAQQRGSASDLASIQAEIARLPAAAKTGASASGLSTPGMQASPTNAEKAAAAAAQARQVKTAEADVVRDTDRQKEGKLYREMRAGLDRSMHILEFGDPTASGAGAITDKVGGFFGMSPRGAVPAAELSTLSGWLTSHVPRMEGPQSNIDVQNYQVMAGRVGDNTIPVDQRLAAAKEVRKLQDKYAHLNGYSNTGGATGDFGGQEKPAAKKFVDELPKTAKVGARMRDADTGKIVKFDGLSWREEK